ncbi:hypothetical protein [Clostridium sp.]|uniref:hypothetical protein n=1 Tax=Clostridium sp. TaxID=1506 RepID=UPI00290B0E37|nr:hypothetical protein [Clostridium sp.]MDU4848498.1 hypothetical protein [Clostridium sp.]
MDRDGFREVARTLSLYHRITEEKLNSNKKSKKGTIEKLYVDLLPNNEILESILEHETTFLVGRKGTGKSTIFARSQYEIHKKKEDLSVYINAKTIFKNSQLNLLDIGTNELACSYEERLKITLIKDIINALIDGMLSELKNENNNWFEKVKNTFRDAELERLVEELQDMLDSEVFENINKMYITSSDTTISCKDVSEIKGSLSPKEVSIFASASEENLHQNKNQNTNILARVFKVGDIINKFLEILKICHRESIYIFIDDYSELDRREREVFMDTIILPMYDIGVDKIYFKIACYPNKMEPIKLEKSKYLITQIDLFEIYGGDHNITNIQQKAIEYTKKLLTNSVNVLCKDSIETYFDLKSNSIDEYYKYLYYVSQNVPRVLGLILRNCYSLSIASNKGITISIINQASKKYYQQHIKMNFIKQPDVRYETNEDKVDMFVQESIVKALINVSQKNKYDLPTEKETNSYFNNIKEAYTSHFTLSEDMAEYVEDLEFNGFIHKINKIAAKGRTRENYKNKTNYLYSLDYGMCIDEKILYGRPKDADTKYYQQRCFIYDDIIMSVLNNNKKVVCKECGHVFPIEELPIIQRFRMKCSECPTGICEIKFDENLMRKAINENNNAIWNEQEFEVVNAIDMLSEEFQDNVTVNLISKEIDYYYQIITSLCRSLARDGYIERNKDVNPYTYKLTDRAKGILKNLNNNTTVTQ